MSQLWPSLGSIVEHTINRFGLRLVKKFPSGRLSAFNAKAQRILLDPCFSEWVQIQ
jgi:hypothetical protein